MKNFLMQIGVCFFVIGFCLYSYLDAQNDLTQLKMQLPKVEKEIELIEEETQRLSYKIDKFENPTNLIELAHKPEYRHLRHPVLREILTVSESSFACD
ncbi:MAG TPA: hypothetical protein VLE96_01375 [Chlamydiales bacterium]|nr:hypothetical protein [Chlamydiales bacterium]